MNNADFFNFLGMNNSAIEARNLIKEAEARAVKQKRLEGLTDAFNSNHTSSNEMLAAFEKKVNQR